MEAAVLAGEKPLSYYTAPWRKARICARLVLHPELMKRVRYAQLAASLVKDPSISNRLIGQAVAQLEAIKYLRTLAS